MAEQTEAELWLASVVSQADVLATQWRLAPPHVVAAHARILSERLHQLDQAATNKGRIVASA